ncbi:hypothetical protein pEaSNUABM50_00369 [Erwinia phage pEa_SNUABM_50]|uniref:Uncharacterized protein n=4 Tax=Eneladusvirus BF TaxID=2560751 RepID=A0A7L8ZN18_9CAUD|nr:hypothetical protein FDH34_gp548 [Serratia phage BF]QOI71310.1 hypothetical protein pEaSNUABM12_00373 [Erwinia phage pEa_SNUABM_12]QOI71853.1 hypothetical protein pEaSNUABM47_00370 [Erwinia phage pEa_SNUABM_47]QOI72392.1 hypothetical protein pEaSNUABM50_00369 [Erwinia phage pEa_SNUABM_50]QXO11519.1 hypothetical protein pEaSNUABM19_00374 [Erwinia phage pEa_SNUABM_19]QXO12067.1 hypothetical protein pEaSNUABM44_00372 [Erwinia phage pEa_SNUABM_44]QXO12620.1 hypothetical protein pEaSNUABM49_003
MANIKLKEEFLLREDDSKPVQYSIEQGEHVFSYFVCTCAEEDKKYWKDKLHDYMPDFDPEKHADMMSQLVMELNWSYNGFITSIGADQWFGLSVDCAIWNKDHTEHETVIISMQCDEVLFGMIAVLEILKKVISDEED